jgi:hypothetical protein
MDWYYWALIIAATLALAVALVRSGLGAENGMAARVVIGIGLMFSTACVAIILGTALAVLGL